MTGRALSRRTALAGLALLTGGLPLRSFAAPAEQVIIIAKLKFGPAPADIAVGDTLVWVNKDMFRHTATARDGSFDVDLQPGAEGRVTVTRSGPVEVFCRFHPGMILQLVVKS